jgi:excisionase family DNA binding protein
LNPSRPRVGPGSFWYRLDLFTDAQRKTRRGAINAAGLATRRYGDKTGTALKVYACGGRTQVESLVFLATYGILSGMNELPAPFKNRMGLRVDEVALMLGVSPETVADWCRKGELPAAKIGRTWFIPPEIMRQKMLGIPFVPERLL